MSHITTNEIFDWICIIMIIFGTIGNSLGLIVFSSRKFRQTTYGKLAITSLIINLLCVYRYSLLLHSNTRRLITYKVAQSWFNCKLYRFSSCLRILSAFVTVAWTYERFTYVTTNIRFFRNTLYVKKYKFYFMTISSLIIVAALTGSTVYFHELVSITLSSHRTSYELNQTLISNIGLSNHTSLDRHSRQDEYITYNQINNRTYQIICGLKESISLSWRHFLTDVRFGLNYTTFRSIFSEIIPSLLVIFFNIGIIISVIKATLSFSKQKKASSIHIRQNHYNSYKTNETVDGLIVHNRPRTSWMNIVLIIHSCLFFFSSLTSTIVHWSTSNPLLSHWTSVVILANCSLNFYVYCLSGKSFRNEIKKLLYDYFELYCCIKFMNLFRSKSQREQIQQTIRMRTVVHRNMNLSTQINSHLRTPLFIQRYY
ncbi:unnamed protein product [Rotaria sordida]|uniref:G-protein coupled receptors family 1 profile domain-containing protein n=2 Tax=Rotaria sordida TaxID=392033 RepID=A0A819Q6T2_9BILA|nr:unnamed protein product [Rotaria sordida]CAF4019665.1 unnamed protein product [Rotaria sordida]